MEVHSNRKVGLKRGRGTGCRNSLMIDHRECVLQDIPHRLECPSIGAVSCPKKTLRVRVEELPSRKNTAPAGHRPT